MLYNPPTGAANANDPYVGKNLTTGAQGSKIPPAVPEFVQREIVAAIVESRQAPTNTDLKQLMRAIRSGRMSVYEDIGTPNALIAASLTKHLEYVPGLPLCLKLANDITAAATLNLDTLGVLPVVYPGGGPLQRYDFLANDLLVGRINAAGTAFVVLSPISQMLIDTAVVKSVHGAGAAFPDMGSAFAWLARRRIASTGSVTFQLAAGVGANRVVYTNDVTFQHPDAQRVTLKGQPLAAAQPAGSLLAFTGYTPSARLADTTTNLATLRNVYSTEVYFQGGRQLIVQAGIGNVQDVMWSSDGSGTGDCVLFSSGVATITRLAFVGAANRGLAAGTAYIVQVGTCYAIGCGGRGLSLEAFSSLAQTAGSTFVTMSNGTVGAGGLSSLLGAASGGASVYSRGNGLDGISAYGGNFNIAGNSTVSRDNGGYGVAGYEGATVKAAGSTSSGNATLGYGAVSQAFVDAQNTTGSGNGTFGYGAINGGNLVRGGGTCTGTSGAASPAVGSTGNGNGYIS